MKFRLRCETLETRENPSGPELLDPTAPIVSPDPAPSQPAPTDPAPTDPVIDPILGVPFNPWGG
ncbi:MAG TPA: hypothetical protein VFG68_10635 [Fimbriiglobus sp.]|nr:hypothetical protein [Fimbriiglobus sp.]